MRLWSSSRCVNRYNAAATQLSPAGSPVHIRRIIRLTKAYTLDRISDPCLTWGKDKDNLKEEVTWVAVRSGVLTANKVVEGSEPAKVKAPVKYLTTVNKEWLLGCSMLTNWKVQRNVMFHTWNNFLTLKMIQELILLGMKIHKFSLCTCLNTKYESSKSPCGRRMDAHHCFKILSPPKAYYSRSSTVAEIHQIGVNLSPTHLCVMHGKQFLADPRGWWCNSNTS